MLDPAISCLNVVLLKSAPDHEKKSELEMWGTAHKTRVATALFFAFFGIA